MSEPPSTALTNTSTNIAQPAVAERAPDTPMVVAAAVLRGTRVLAQQRAHPVATAGRWELPGGRVEPHENARDALVRECREELAVEIVPGEQLGPDVPLPGGYVLRVHAARLSDPTARPIPVEHAALRWVDVTELASLDWLDADRTLLPDLEPLLRGPRCDKHPCRGPRWPPDRDKHPCDGGCGPGRCDKHPDGSG